MGKDITTRIEKLLTLLSFHILITVIIPPLINRIIPKTSIARILNKKPTWLTNPPIVIKPKVKIKR